MTDGTVADYEAVKYAVQSVYQWALDVEGNRQSPGVLMLCAKNVRQLVELHDDYAEAATKIAALVEDWRRHCRGRERGTTPNLAKAIQIVSAILGLQE